VDEVRPDNCPEPGKLPSISAAQSLHAGLESAGCKVKVWLQTKLNQVLRKPLLAGVKNLVTTGHLQCLSSKAILGVLQMGWWQSFACSGCGVQWAAFLTLSRRNWCGRWACCSHVVPACKISIGVLPSVLKAVEGWFCCRVNLACWLCVALS